MFKSRSLEKALIEEVQSLATECKARLKSLDDKIRYLRSSVHTDYNLIKAVKVANQAAEEFNATDKISFSRLKIMLDDYKLLAETISGLNQSVETAYAKAIEDFNRYISSHVSHLGSIIERWNSSAENLTDLNTVAEGALSRADSIRLSAK